MKSEEFSKSCYTCVNTSNDLEKDHETFYSLYDLLDPLTRIMFSNIKDVYNTKNKLKEQLDCLIEKLKICLDLVNIQVLEGVYSDCIQLKERMNLIHKTFGEIESRIEKCCSILNQYQS
ncbi:hypothetical protein PNEG_00874 [Pneumocystis murina B123]|uniref:Biogenesis of lysosome-related organelles complex 1 subunit 7 n=1 Tax=Pneumocystis murina (strain B123) TaxID=1069680 RepID=M7PJU7_PNEMU|nr:hypothetical protein PNEG_00874 [Pneumocystis murina B123]EMR10724.1 hypothetical protein PNEG_00874 [Pneumocystis murina B123]